MRTSLRLVTCAALLGTCGGGLALEPQEPSDENPSVKAMASLASRTRVEIPSDDGQPPRVAELVQQPVFRYVEEMRRIHDSTLWVWQDQGRPAAFQKIETNAYFTPPGWTYCFTALAEPRVKVTWPNTRQSYTSARPVEFSRVPDAPEPGETRAVRDRQFRAIARKFSAAQDEGPQRSFLQKLRLLPRPIYEYEAPEKQITAGAVFGFVSGTNPDLLLVLELHTDQAGADRWQYAPARMTCYGLTLQYADEEVWSDPPEPRPGAFETWTYLFLRGGIQ